MKEVKKAAMADRLREAMAAAGKKQADLVRETGLDRAAISSYLSGKYEPKQKAINKLAVALDVSEMWLFGYDVPRERSLEQKKNDDLVKIVGMMRKNPDLLEVVSLLSKLPAEDYASVKRIVSALLQK